MKELLFYLLQMIITSGILYAYYHFALRNKKFHRYNRFYLLAAAMISILIPFLNIPVYFSGQQTDSSFILQTLTVISSPEGNDIVTTRPAVPATYTSWFTWQNILYLFYCMIVFVALFRIFYSIRKIKRIIRNNPVEMLDKIHFVNTDEPGTPFSFFRWLFWNKRIELQSPKGEQIFRHELFHIEQKHSLDILFMEFLTSICWLNPFFHLMKKEIKAIHEFLADQFAITENTKWQYAELLLMQALNTKLPLVNPFFHNQIKRRIAMIITTKKPGSQYLRKLMVLPVTAIVVALFAFSYKNQYAKTQILPKDNEITVVIDPGHGMDATGNQNGAMAPDGSYEGDIVLTIAKKIRALNTNDRVKIILTREDKNFVAVAKRMEFANSQNADLFISLHTNTTLEKNTDKKGIDIFVPDKNKKYYSENRILASILFNYFSQIQSVINIQKRKAGIYVIDNSNCPSALVECGYLSNPDDLAFMKDAAGQEKIAKIILQSVEQYAMQKGSDDWEQRKKSFADTLKPDIRFIKNPSNGKLEGLYNGEKIKEFNLFEPTGQLVLIFENNNFVMLSEDFSKEIKKKYSSDFNQLITRKIEKESKDTDNKIFDKVEIEPSFPGGNNKWRQYLEMNLDAAIPVRKKAPDGDYTVIVQFVVNKEGNISDIKALTKHGYGMEEEAIRVIKSGPRWQPAMQNGQYVKAYRKQPITFVIGTKGSSTKFYDTDYPQEFLKEVVVTSFENNNSMSPKFPGSDSAWRKYLEKNLDASVPLKNKAPIGTYTVVAQFVVDKDGNISDVKALTNHGYGMEEEAIRVIKSEPRWVPAMQNGYYVKAYKKQPITFVVTDDPDNFVIIENKTSVFLEKDKKMLDLNPSVLYIGVDNYITVTCSGVNKEDLIVSVSQGEITGANGKYYIKVFAVSEAVVLKVSTKDGKELGTQVFKARTIPSPIPLRK